MLVSQRDISASEYSNFKKEFRKASVTLENNKEKMEETYNILEQKLILLGVTAIEDCLQDDLNVTLKSFRECGIKIWMLTGDNALTAVSISHSCGLITKNYLTSMITDIKDIDKQLEEIKNRLLIKAIEKESKNQEMKHCFVLTGDVLGLVLNTYAFDEIKNEIKRQRLIKQGKKTNDPIYSDDDQAKLKIIKSVKI